MKYRRTRGASFVTFSQFEVHEFEDMNGVKMQFRVWPHELRNPHQRPLHEERSGIAVYEEVEDYNGDKCMVLEWGSEWDENQESKATLRYLLDKCLFTVGEQSNAFVTRENHPSVFSRGEHEHLFFFQTPTGKLRAIGMYHRYEEMITGATIPSAVIRFSPNTTLRVTTPSTLQEAE